MNEGTFEVRNDQLNSQDIVEIAEPTNHRNQLNPLKSSERDPQNP